MRHPRQPRNHSSEIKAMQLLFNSPKLASDDWLQIAFVGSHGTGKTMLSHEVFKWMRRELDLPVIPIFESTRMFQLDQQEKDYERKLIQKRASEFTHFGHFISDRSLIDPLGYQKVVRGKIDASIKEFAFTHSKQLLFYIPISFDIVDDGIRPIDKDYQQKVQDAIKGILDESQLTYYTISRVDMVERLNFVKHVVLHREGWYDKLYS